MFRQGLAELRAAMYPDGNVAQPAQYGLYGTRTPGEVMQERKAEGRDVDEQPSVVDERVRQTETGGDGREPDSKEPEKE
jgi:hypothetical protein